MVCYLDWQLPKPKLDHLADRSKDGVGAVGASAGCGGAGDGVGGADWRLQLSMDIHEIRGIYGYP